GILRGIYRYKAAEGGEAQIHLFGSGPILNEALRAQKMLAEKWQVRADVWSVTSYNELRRDALEVERWNRLHPTEPERKPYLFHALEGVNGPIVASTDYMKIVPDQIAPWLPGRLVSLGTDGFERSGSDRQRGAVASRSGWAVRRRQSGRGRTGTGHRSGPYRPREAVNGYPACCREGLWPASASTAGWQPAADWQSASGSRLHYLVDQA